MCIATPVTQMDISFNTEEGKFNYRVSAVMIHDGRILAARGERAPYYYLPGGRVALHENAEQALLRELKEEMGIDATVVRPLWLCQSFFNEDVTKEQFHELCLYFLVDVSDTGILERGEHFRMHERHHTHDFTWLPLESLRDTYIYPVFIRERILDLPRHLTLIEEHQ